MSSDRVHKLVLKLIESRSLDVVVLRNQFDRLTQRQSLLDVTSLR